MTVVLLFASCTKDMMRDIQPNEALTRADIQLKPDLDINLELAAAPGMPLVLGRRLDNPYSVKNMTVAAKSLELDPNFIKNPTRIPKVVTSHYYVKFMPVTAEELATLQQDSTLVLYDFPLDYEIVENGDEYHDPSIPDSLPTYQYASIEAPKWRQMKSTLTIRYEVLENLFIPDEDTIVEIKKSVLRNSMADDESKDWEAINALVNEAMDLTGNHQPVLPVTRSSSKWRPAGKIMYKSAEKGWIGLHGVKVKARRWFTTHTGIVDSQGSYSCNGRFERPANYHFNWERYEFEIRRSALATAKYGGPKKKGDWNVWIEATQKHDFFRATIFRAAYHYCYQDIKGLHRPPQNGAFKTQLKIREYFEENGDVNGTTKPSRRFLGLGSMIKIYNPARAESEVYATTIHELAHAAHWGMYKSDYNNANDFVTESWARGVQYYLTRQKYPNYTVGFGVCAYTGIVIDLIDEANVTKFCSGYYLKVNDSWKWSAYKDSTGDYIDKSYSDRVAGYTLTQVESALNGTRNAKQWENNLTKLSNETMQYLPATFTFWSVK